MTVHIHLETVLPMTTADAFDLSTDLDVHLDSMSSSRERIVGGRTSGRIVGGEHVAWRARHIGAPFTLVSRISRFERPSVFVDEEIAGPFRRFRHEHRFEPHADGCLMIDDLDIEAPFGALGRIVERLVLERYLHELIASRNGHLLEVARRRSEARGD